MEEWTGDCCKILGWDEYSGEIPIEHGDSWLSAKFILVKQSIIRIIGKALFYYGFSQEIPWYSNPKNDNM